MLEGMHALEEVTVQYVIYEDGTTGRMVAGGCMPELARPGTIVPEAVYLAEVEALEAQSAAQLAELESADRARTLADYTALTVLGLPDETARRLSGHVELPEVDGPLDG